MRRVLALPLLLLPHGAAAADVDCAKMKTKELRRFLAARDVTCSGCAEKSDYVALCEQHKDTPEKPPPEPEPEKEKSIEELMAGLKGMPGMEGIKMFSADDFKGKNFEQMGDMFGGGKPRSTTRAEHRQRLVDFYTQYGLTDKLDGVDAALDKWKGREERMFDKLYEKYDAEIRAKWDSEKDGYGADDIPPPYEAKDEV